MKNSALHRASHTVQVYINVYRMGWRCGKACWVVLVGTWGWWGVLGGNIAALLREYLVLSIVM